MTRDERVALLEGQLQEDVRDEIPDTTSSVERALAAMEQAGSCETNTDLLTNLREAEEQLRDALRQARSLADKTLRVVKALEKLGTPG